MSRMWKASVLRARMPLRGDLASLSLFHKRLREIDVPLAGMERKGILLSGASLEVDCGVHFGVSLGWLEKRSQREGTIAPSDSYRRGLVAGVHRNFGKAGVIRLQYERIDAHVSELGVETESAADMCSLYSSLKF